MSLADGCNIVSGVLTIGLAIWGAAVPPASTALRVSFLMIGIFAAIALTGGIVLTSQSEDAKYVALLAQIHDMTTKIVKTNPVTERLGHFQFTSKGIASPDPSYSYAVQVVVLTDETIDHPGFIVTCDGPIAKGSAFIPGQVIYTMREDVIADDKKSFGIKFATPPLTPEAPLIITLLSNEDIHCDKLQDARLTQFTIKH